MPGFLRRWRGRRCGDGELRPLAQPDRCPQETHDTLAQLAENGRWWRYQRQRPAGTFGLSDYFRFVLRAGPDGRSKPFADMYHLAAERLALPLGRFCTSGMI
jgi:putative hydrolase of the HAD superfamily